MLSSGHFLGVWILYADVSEHFVYSIFIPTCLWIWNRESVPKRRHIKFRCQGIAQKKAYKIQNTAKVSKTRSSEPVLNVAAMKALDEPLYHFFWTCVRINLEDNKYRKSNCELWVAVANSVPSHPSVHFVHDIAWWVTGQSVGHARPQLSIRFTTYTLREGLLAVRATPVASPTVTPSLSWAGSGEFFLFAPSSLFV